MTQNGANPPIAKKISHLITIHDHTRNDEYYWLNDRENTEVIDYLNAENEFTEKVMLPIEKLKENLFEEMKGRIKEKDESVPYKNGNYYYYSKYIEGGEYPIFCRKKTSLNNLEEIMLDGNEMAKGQSYFQFGGFEISDNEDIIAFSSDNVSRRNYVLQFKNLKTGEIYPEKIENTEGGSFAWAADNKTFFYIIRDQQTLLGDKVYKHLLGTDPQFDELVYEEINNEYYMGLGRMKSKKFIAIFSEQNGVATEYQLIDASKPNEKPKTFLKRAVGLEYYLEHFENKFFIRSNYQNSPNFQISQVEEDQATDTKNWKTMIPHREDVFLEGLEVFKNHLVIQERKEGLINLRIINQIDKKEHFLDFGEPTYDAFIGINYEFDTQVLRFGYNSMTTPSSTFEYNMVSKVKTLLKEQEILGGFDKANYKTERIYIKARDGVNVPVSIVYHKNTKINGTAPLLQYAYGSYGASMDASFSPSRLSLLDRGFVYAICHIRGGQEMGRKWYEGGKMFNKKNTFNDFEDCSRGLITQNFASKDNLFAMGGSAGGLLMGAIVNQAPELYKGIVAAVPFVDVVTTMLDETIPLTTGEFEEWGNPKNKDSYNYMLTYSPYDNISKQKYPNILVTTGLHDSQVQYWEPAKWVAKLREHKKDNNILLLHTDMTSGHSGASGRFSALKNTSVMFSFILDLAGKLN
ncbi:S9 family peptidase [Lacihabitans sp. LS3-19]|uniref:S9 family peptidase n=1 Tax=Lacihabitans sp. LS3-19 TaxID=2487335 RepID=UPI0020CD1219|nr:S9 family peptidase [Lacihabitans sp. LS3-19]MCP9769220.1 S9 family peptidase [Lacihabitans sp. LS3-19]